MALEIYCVYYMQKDGHPSLLWAFVTKEAAEKYKAKKRGHIPHVLHIGKCMF